MRLSAALLAVSLLGILAGGWLTGRLGFGLCVIADSLAVGAWALLRDDRRAEAPSVHEVPTLAAVLERAQAVRVTGYPWWQWLLWFGIMTPAALLFLLWIDAGVSPRQAWRLLRCRNERP